jgi:MYXO-CTERM domain-containing protein
MNKLNLKLLAGSLALVALPALASADARRELGAAQGFTIAPASMTTDLAETRTIQTPNGPVEVLRYNDQDMTQEMAVVKVSPDGRRALYVHMRTAPVNEGTAMEANPPNRMQCALTVLDIGLDAATGGFTVARPTTGPGMYDRFITDNDGNEYRNCNRPSMTLVNGGQNVAVSYNYQPNNDSIRYMQIFDWDGQNVTIRNSNGTQQQQVIVGQFNNDDCCTGQDGVAEDIVYDQGGVTRLVSFYGHNGDGGDDASVQGINVACTGAGATADCTITRQYDLIIENEEERTRGRCTSGGADKSFVVCTWTAGDTQPCYEGVWVGAVDVSAEGENGPNAQSRLLWKERIELREDLIVNGQPREYYAMRANHGRLLQMNPDGSMTPSSQVMLTYGLNRGNNQDGEKGGRTDAVIAAVLETSRTGFTYAMPKTNIQPLLLGTDNTHVHMQHAMFGKGSEVLPGFTLVHGDHTGGAARNSDLRTIAYNPVTKEMLNLGQHDLGRSYDRHLYSNYLGNNPGNQGRNFATCDLVKSPFADMPNNHVTYFQACALTGKLAEQSEAMYKTSALLSIFPVAFTEAAPPPGGGWNEEDLPGEDNPTQGPDEGPGSSVGGCSTSSGSSGLLFALALGLATFIRRRK